MGGYATRVNRFLSLTLSLMMTVTPPASFLALRPGSRALLRSFPLVRSPCSAWSFTLVGRRRRPTHGTLVGQGLPGRNHGIHYASSKMSRTLIMRRWEAWNPEVARLWLHRVRALPEVRLSAEVWRGLVSLCELPVRPFVPGWAPPMPASPWCFPFPHVAACSGARQWLRPERCLRDWAWS